VSWIYALTARNIKEAAMDFHPILTDEDHRAALKEIESLWGSKKKLDAYRMDILVTMVEAYEREHWPVDTSRLDPIDMLTYLIDEGGHTQAELGELLGSRPRASEILNRKRALTVEMIHKISEAWKIPAELLIKPYKIVKAA
jgi:HTH-type transcriptional regulator/antitoxin HigA